MARSRTVRDKGEPGMEQPGAALERMYIEEYLRDRGYTWRSLSGLPAEEARRLMIEASQYASCKLAEVEKRARFVKDIHGRTPPLG